MLDQVVVVALPLRVGFDHRIATFDAFGDATSYHVRVTGEYTLSLGGKQFNVWRAEREQGGQAVTTANTSGQVSVRTTWFVDSATPRVLLEQFAVNAPGMNSERVRVRVLRHP